MSKTIFFLLFLLSAAMSSARDKGENWIEVSSPHFRVISNGNEKQSLHVADQFERMRAVFHKLFPDMQVDPASPIVVIAVKNEKDFRLLEPEAYLAKGSLELAGLFLRAPDKNYVLLRLDAGGEHPYETVYHEYTHLLTSKAEWLPLWLNEGLAEFYENTDIRDKEVILGQPNAGNILLLRENRLLPLSVLFVIDHTSPYYHEESKGSIFYAESWALTHYLMVKGRVENRDPLGDYARFLTQQMDSTTAATRAFGDLKQLQSSLEKYVNQMSFNAFKMAALTEVDDAAFKTQMLTLPQADATRADFLAYNDRSKDSKALLDEVLHDDPNNTLAHETMGYLEFRQGHLEEALKWYEQAVKLDSQSYLAHYYFAVIAMRHSQLDTDGDARVESSLRTAIKLNPSFAPSYDQLAVFYGMRHKNLDEAHLLSANAVQLDPTNLQFRMNAANVLLVQGREKDSISVLQAALKLAKTPEEVGAVQNEMEIAQQSQSSRERIAEENQKFKEEMAAQATSSSTTTMGDSTTEAPALKETLKGPHRFVTGTIKNVHCSSPSNMDLDVDGGGKTLSLYTHNYYKLVFTALNFMPKGDLQPCSDLEGMHAKVEYIETAGAAKAGGLVSIELRK